MRPGPAWDAGKVPPRADPGRPVPTTRGVGEQVPFCRFPHLSGHMLTDGFGQMIAHPPATFDVFFGHASDSVARQPQPLPQCRWTGCAFMVGGPIRPTPCRGVALQRPPQPKHRRPVALQPPAGDGIGHIEFQARHRHRAFIAEVLCLRLTAPPHHLTTDRGGCLGVRDCHGDHEIITHRQRPLCTIDATYRRLLH